jgi:citronellol/citronellal dehydrogenase
MADLAGRTVFISGASRGIGLAIAKRIARDSANIALIAKTAEPHPKLPGTIYTAAKEIEDEGGRALPIVGDIRFEDQVEAAVAKTVETFGGIDICVNNASAINLSDIESLPVSRYDLMQDINARGTFVCMKACIPHLRRSDHAHILTLSPPLNVAPHWLSPHAAYTLSKYGMTMLTLGAGRDLADAGIAANCLWPRTIIATAAIRNLLGGDEAMARARTPEIYADAAYEILRRDPRSCTGHTYIDDEVLAEAGITDVDVYAVKPGTELRGDIFVDPVGEPAARV